MTVFALRPETALRDVGAVLEALGFEVAGVEGGGDDDLRRITLADEAGTTRAAVVEDGYLDVAYLVLTGPGAGRVAARVVEERLAFDAATLLEAARAGLDPLARESLKGLVRLALAAGPDLAPDLLALFERLVAEGAEAVRFTLISAVSCRAVYPGGIGPFRRVLDALADDDPSEMVREEAIVLRDALGYV